MGIYNDLMSQLDNAGVLFNVREEGVLTASGDVIPNRKCLINEASNHVMSIVSTGYKTVSNEQIFSGFCQAVENSGIKADGAQIQVKQTATGSRAMVDFIFPEQLLEINGDTTALQLCALNSFDGSTRYLTKAGGLRMKCLNGQILGNIVGSYSSTHNSRLDVDAGAQSVISMITEFNSAKDYWGAMMKRKITFEASGKVRAAFLGLKYDDKIQNNSRYDRLAEIHQRYVTEMGSTVWALYNALTEYATHTRPKDGDPQYQMASRMRNRLERVLGSQECFAMA